MKRLGLLLGLVLAPVMGWSGKPLVAEAPFEVCADAFSVALTTFSWTRVPSSQCVGRTGLFVNALSQNTGTARCIPTSSTTTPASSTSTVAVWEMVPSANAALIGARDTTYLWCVTTHSATENVSGVEVKQ